MRLDEWLVKNGNFASRSRACDAVARGCVTVDGKVASKSGQKVHPKSTVEVRDPAQHLVSRAGLKLQAALDHFSIEISGKTCLDIGISTGGFTQILLQRGAAHVIGIDVGRRQLHKSLQNEDRLTLHEGVNVRQLEKHHLGEKAPQLLVCDVSFISLKIALPSALALMVQGAEAILLIKPQFEVGRSALDNRGLVRDKNLARNIAHDILHWLDEQPGWRSHALIPSPIAGGDGNHEFLLYGSKDSMA